MVFGWGKKKEEEKPLEEIPQNKEIKLSDVQKVVTELYQLRTSQTISEIKHLRNDTEPLIDDLIKIGNMLEKDDLKVDDIDKHLAIIVVRGKKQVIDVIKKGVTHLPEISTMGDAEKLNSSLNFRSDRRDLNTFSRSSRRAINVSGTNFPPYGPKCPFLSGMLISISSVVN